MSAAAVEHDGFIDTYAALPVERFDEASDDAKRQSNSTSSAASTHTGAASAAAPIVHAHNLHKTYLLGVEGVPALRGVNLSIAAGEFIMILGTSGGGKTSLLNIIGTIDKPTKGDITICGQRITSTTTDRQFADLRLRRIGFVFQTFNLIPSMNAEENVALPMILGGEKSRASIARRARELLTRVGLGHRLDHLPSQLSGGEQQRVTIARAIANRPQLLLLDEPTGDLDTVNGTIILGLLLQLNRHEGITCVMVTHDQSLKHYAHRVVHMVDGKVLRIETIDQHERMRADTELQKKVAEIEGNRHQQQQDEQQQRDAELANGGQGSLDSASGGGGKTEWRDTANYYEYIRQQQQQARHGLPTSVAQSAQPTGAGTYAVLPGVTAIVDSGDGANRPPVRIEAAMNFAS